MPSEGLKSLPGTASAKMWRAWVNLRAPQTYGKGQIMMIGLVGGPHGDMAHYQQEVLRLLASVHFPRNTLLQKFDDEEASQVASLECATHWVVAGRVVNFSRIRWAVISLSPFKVSELDEGRPVSLQQGIQTLLRVL